MQTTHNKWSNTIDSFLIQTHTHLSRISFRLDRNKTMIYTNYLLKIVRSKIFNGFECSNQTLKQKSSSICFTIKHTNIYTFSLAFCTIIHIPNSFWIRRQNTSIQMALKCANTILPNGTMQSSRGSTEDFKNFFYSSITFIAVYMFKITIARRHLLLPKQARLSWSGKKNNSCNSCSNDGDCV